MGSRQWCYDGYALVETNDEHAYVYITRGAYPEIKTLVPFYQIEEQVMGRLEAVVTATAGRRCGFWTFVLTVMPAICGG